MESTFSVVVHDIGCKLAAIQVSTIQALIKYNKTQIKELDTERAYLRHIIQLYYNSCNPMDPYGVVSSTAFYCLNQAKDDLAVIKKKLKLLSELQASLKYAVR